MWTSSNDYAFLAIVDTTLIRMAIWVFFFFLFLYMLYISNFACVRRLLIDFCELVGEHSGKNMAEVVWESLVPYGIHGHVTTKLTSIIINLI